MIRDFAEECVVEEFGREEDQRFLLVVSNIPLLVLVSFLCASVFFPGTIPLRVFIHVGFFAGVVSLMRSLSFPGTRERMHRMRNIERYVMERICRRPQIGVALFSWWLERQHTRALEAREQKLLKDDSL